MIVNQILFVKEKEKTADINNVVKFFCVAVIAFGVFLIGQGSYAVARNVAINNLQKIAQITVPQVELEQKNDSLQQNYLVIISVTHDKAVNKIEYHWNNGLTNEINGNSRTRFKEEIDLLVGKNTLYVTVTDINGIEGKYEKYFELIDNSTSGGNVTENVKPTIELTNEGTNLKITVKDETKLKYMTYKWNSDEEIKVELEEGQDDKIIEQEIQIPSGSNILTVTAIDDNGNHNVTTKTYVTATKPKLEVTQDGKNIVIKASHENKVTNVKLNINGQEYELKPSTEVKEINWKGELLVSGQNKIKAVAYTTYLVDGRDVEVTETVETTFNY